MESNDEVLRILNRAPDLNLAWVVSADSKMPGYLAIVRRTYSGPLEGGTR